VVGRYHFALPAVAVVEGAVAEQLDALALRDVDCRAEIVQRDSGGEVGRRG